MQIKAVWYKHTDQQYEENEPGLKKQLYISTRIFYINIGTIVRLVQKTGFIAVGLLGCLHNMTGSTT